MTTIEMASRYIDVRGAVCSFKAGLPVIVLDDRREMEGDLAVPAEMATPEVIKFMVSKCSGLLCMAMPRSVLDHIGIPRMLSSGGNHLEAPFYYPVDAASLMANGRGGTSAWDRWETVQVLTRGPACDVRDLVWPGHLIMLGARDGGMRERVGHTEACTDLAVMAGLKPYALLCEILDDEGEMAREGRLEDFALQHRLPIVRVSDLVQQRRNEYSVS